MVIFFRLTNSPATFQVMMNELLRDLINTGKVAAFIDDVIVGTETEEGHDELVAECYSVRIWTDFRVRVSGQR